MPERDFIEKQQRRMNGAAGGLAHSSVGANPPGPLPGRGPRVGSRENQSVGAKARQKVTNRMADWRRQNGDIQDPGGYWQDLGLAAPTRSIGSSPGPEPPPPRDSEVNTGANRNQTARNALGAPFGQDDVQQEEFLGLDPRIHGNKGQAPAPQAPQAPQAPPQAQAPPAPPAQPGQADVQGAAPPQAPVPPPQPPQAPAPPGQAAPPVQPEQPQTPEQAQQFAQSILSQAPPQDYNSAVQQLEAAKEFANRTLQAGRPPGAGQPQVASSADAGQSVQGPPGSPESIDAVKGAAVEELKAGALPMPPGEVNARGEFEPRVDISQQELGKIINAQQEAMVQQNLPEPALPKSPLGNDSPIEQADAAGKLRAGQKHHLRKIGMGQPGMDAKTAKRFEQQAVRDMDLFGEYEGMDDPHAPPPPIRVGKHSFNPMTGQWVQPEGQVGILDRMAPQEGTTNPPTMNKV